MARSIPFDELLERHLSRRALLAGVSAVAALRLVSRADPAHGGSDYRGPEGTPVAPSKSTLRFKALPHTIAPDHAVADGYDARVLVRHGDGLFADAPAFAAGKADARAQERQFGANADFLAFLPLPKGSTNSAHGLLAVNHEYTALYMLVPGLTQATERESSTREQHAYEQAAHGLSVVEVRRVDGAWSVVRDSKFARRVTGRTPVRVSGPAAGHVRLVTKADPTGREVLGTLNNCAGGVTPWGTVLTCEENINWYFAGKTDDAREARNHARYGVGNELVFGWHRFEERFDVAVEPHEPNRYGWVVEYDPYDPASTPVKRTALGRVKHEGATCVLNHDGRVVVYMGDDDEFEFVYKFVTAKPFDPRDPTAARALLDSGTLYVARFEDGDALHWLPLVHGTGPLTKENGFDSQADVLIETRRAATLLGATPMDRPEDVETNPVDGRVFVMLTSNKERKSDQVDAANPRANNREGHVLELSPPRTTSGARDHAATRFAWSVFLIAGNPHDAASGARYGERSEPEHWLSRPDNCAFDPKGRLWIATDGMIGSKACDGVFACDTEGTGTAETKRFFRAPIGAEVCGPCFTPDGKTLFLSIQHPGDADQDGKTKGISYSTPSTRWPDFHAEVPPRASIVVVTKQDGGTIGD